MFYCNFISDTDHSDRSLPILTIPDAYNAENMAEVESLKSLCWTAVKTHPNYSKYFEEEQDSSDGKDFSGTDDDDDFVPGKNRKRKRFALSLASSSSSSSASSSAAESSSGSSSSSSDSDSSSNSSKSFKKGKKRTRNTAKWKRNKTKLLRNGQYDKKINKKSKKYRF